MKLVIMINVNSVLQSDRSSSVGLRWSFITYSFRSSVLSVFIELDSEGLFRKRRAFNMPTMLYQLLSTLLIAVCLIQRFGGTKAQNTDKYYLRQRFRAFDRDESGYIEPRELEYVLGITGEYVADAIVNIMKKSDTNYDGKLDIQEFIDMMTG